jgi:glycosyltransferase involved in cell wall biosynthesis
MNRVSFIIPVVNNFEYTKHVYENLKEYYPDDEIIISDGGSTDETIEYFTQLVDSNLKFVSNGKLNLCENYNCGVEHSTTDIVILLHNDMFVPPNFKERVISKLDSNTIMSYARIEPPVFPGEEPGKVVRDFGYDLSTLNKPAIIEFSETYNSVYPGGGYLFIACHKSNWIGMDEKIFNPPQMWAADDDLHLRFRLSNFTLLISDAIVYHFVSKTSRASDSYKQVELNSNRNFIRKWGQRNLQSIVKYNIAYVVKNCTPNLLPLFEPFCDRLYVDDHGTMITNYIETEQPNTIYDLKIRVLNTNLNDPFNENDIVVAIDGKTFTQTDFQYIQQLSEILQDSGQPGTFKLGNCQITIVSLIAQESQLIVCKR